MHIRSPSIMLSAKPFYVWVTGMQTHAGRVPEAKKWGVFDTRKRNVIDLKSFSDLHHALDCTVLYILARSSQKVCLRITYVSVLPWCCLLSAALKTDSQSVSQSVSTSIDVVVVAAACTPLLCEPYLVLSSLQLFTESSLVVVV